MNTRAYIKLDAVCNQEIPSWIIWVQCACFAVMYSIWNHPQTNFLSDVCMVIGALSSTYVLYIYRDFFKTKSAIPFWLLLGLFGWVIFHLLFLSNQYELQLREFTSIWKRCSIASIFALGYGVSLSRAKASAGYWKLFYFGMLMPAIIFLFKYLFGIFGAKFGWIIPDYLILYPNRTSIYFVYKTDYTALCLPALAISLCALKQNLHNERLFVFSNLIYLFGIFATLQTFYLNNIKNALAYSALLFLAFIALMVRSGILKLKSAYSSIGKIKNSIIELLILVLMVVISAPLISKHIEQNPSWRTLWADSKVAVRVDEIDQWKYFGAKDFPLNEYGVVVSRTNYERVAWGIVGLRLIGENPLGYGLVYRSFADLTKLKWPESMLDQSHSGWIDLTLGIGLPGTGLLFLAFLMILIRAKRGAPKDQKLTYQYFWPPKLSWVLWAILLIWCTSEVSQKENLIALVFWISLASGILSHSRQESSKVVMGRSKIPSLH
jgi:hypothetical protein